MSSLVCPRLPSFVLLIRSRLVRFRFPLVCLVCFRFVVLVLARFVSPVRFRLVCLGRWSYAFLLLVGLACFGFPFLGHVYRLGCLVLRRLVRLECVRCARLARLRFLELSLAHPSCLSLLRLVRHSCQCLARIGRWFGLVFAVVSVVALTRSSAWYQRIHQVMWSLLGVACSVGRNQVSTPMRVWPGRMIILILVRVASVEVLTMYPGMELGIRPPIRGCLIFRVLASLTIKCCGRRIATDTSLDWRHSMHGALPMLKSGGGVTEVTSISRDKFLCGPGCQRWLNPRSVCR